MVDYYKAAILNRSLRVKCPVKCLYVFFHREHTWGHRGLGEGEGGTNGESIMGTYTLPYVIEIASGNLLYDSGGSNWCSVIA